VDDGEELAQGTDPLDPSDDQPEDSTGPGDDGDSGLDSDALDQQGQGLDPTEGVEGKLLGGACGGCTSGGVGGGLLAVLFGLFGAARRREP
jgi:MYXO-CTERM domain-containing protein